MSSSHRPSLLELSLLNAQVQIENMISEIDNGQHNYTPEEVKVILTSIRGFVESGQRYNECLSRHEGEFAQKPKLKVVK